MSDDQREITPFLTPTTFTDRKERDYGRDGDRRRSRSPQRDRDRREDRPRRKDAGFKWKEKRRDDDDTSRRDRDSGLQRGYRDHYRPRSRARSPVPQRHAPNRDDPDRDGKRGRNETLSREEKKEKREKKEKKPTPGVPAQPMIIVYVNDRLGTKKAIPCFPTDPISKSKMS